MNEKIKVTCTIHFIDGNKKSFQFDRKEQPGVSGMRAMSETTQVIETLLKEDKLALEIDGKFVIIPMNNVRFIEVDPTIPNLSPRYIRAATV